ncbi:uncharacterized protein LOC132559574 [Ylistrum balloti]|uniref:uncharacterized protein LOC132559574 n=1 Tax=Ylistrum balloti TaxID=509963 RepID=UPI002905BCE8|nr:uncharacterized protein LOC132559574 [Ylistrum balloti]
MFLSGAIKVSDTQITKNTCKCYAGTTRSVSKVHGKLAKITALRNYHACSKNSCGLPRTASRLVIHMLDDLQYVECFSVGCPAGSQLSFCKKNKTSDYCHDCPGGSTQPLPVNSKTVRTREEIPKCVRANIDCPPEAVPALEDGIDCRCDASRGYIGSDYMLCLKYTKCPPGTAFETENGACRICPVGTFNPESGYGPCISHTDCALNNRETVLFGNTTVDNVCGELIELQVVNVTTANTLLKGKKENRENLRQTPTEELKQIPDASLKHPPDRALVVTERHTGIPMLVTLVMGVNILLLTILLSVVIYKWRKGININGKPSMPANVDRTQTGGNDKPGVQVEEDCGPEYALKATDDTGSSTEDQSLMSMTGEEPGTLTIYPQINAVPCVPTAPSMTPSMMI